MSYRIRKWSEYNAGLKQRGSLTFWIFSEILANWEVKEKTGKPGAAPTYKNQAIVTMVSFKSVMTFFLNPYWAVYLREYAIRLLKPSIRQSTAP